MITKQNIKTLYKQYNNHPESINQLNTQELLDNTAEYHGTYIDPNTDELIISSITNTSPFRTIPLRNIHTIIQIENWSAIVLMSSIIFLDHNSSKVCIDIKDFH